MAGFLRVWGDSRHLKAHMQIHMYVWLAVEFLGDPDLWGLKVLYWVSVVRILVRASTGLLVDMTNWLDALERFVEAVRREADVPALKELAILRELLVDGKMSVAAEVRLRSDSFGLTRRPPAAALDDYRGRSGARRGQEIQGGIATSPPGG